MRGQAKQHVVLCEGFDDRAFWKGWLLYLGCTDPTDGGRRRVTDIRGRIVTGQGRFLFRTPSGSDVVVQPFHGRNNARQAAEEYLGNRQPFRPARVVLNLDGDEESEGAGSAKARIRAIAESLFAVGEERGPFEIDGSLLYGVVWECDDPPATPGVPRQQTLERLVTASLCAADTKRGAGVERWLEAEPTGLKLPKSYGYSYYAKWYADHGEMHFYECVWHNEAVVRELRNRLEGSGAWQYVDELVCD